LAQVIRSHPRQCIVPRNSPSVVCATPLVFSQNTLMLPSSTDNDVVISGPPLKRGKLEHDSKTLPAHRADCSFFTLFDDDSDDDYCPVADPGLEDSFAFDAATLLHLSNKALETESKDAARGQKLKIAGDPKIKQIDVKHSVREFFVRKSTHPVLHGAHSESGSSTSVGFMLDVPSSGLFPVTQETSSCGVQSVPDRRVGFVEVGCAFQPVVGQKERRDWKDVKREKMKGVQKKLKALGNSFRK